MFRVAFAVVLSSITMFLLAGLYTGMLARDFIATHVRPDMLRTPPNLLLVAAGYLLLGLLMAVIYRRFMLPTDAPLKSGLFFGMAAGVCWLMPYSLVLFGVYAFPEVALLPDFAWALVEQGIGGLVIGGILGRSQR